MVSRQFFASAPIGQAGCLTSFALKCFGIRSLPIQRSEPRPAPVCGCRSNWTKLASIANQEKRRHRGLAQSFARRHGRRPLNARDGWLLPTAGGLAGGAEQRACERLGVATEPQAPNVGQASRLSSAGVRVRDWHPGLSIAPAGRGTPCAPQRQARRLSYVGG